MRSTIRRTLAATSALALLGGVTACSEGEASETDTDADAITETSSDQVSVDSMAGLEVTAVGNISDILSDEALRLDRDGLGNAEDQGEVGSPLESWDYEYDYDYYDYDDLTGYDEDFDDADLTDEGVLVVTGAGIQGRKVDEAVRVSGTVRRFDQDSIESVYDVDLEDDTYDQYEDSLVIVADSIKPASAGPATASQNPSQSASPSETAS